MNDISTQYITISPPLYSQLVMAGMQLKCMQYTSYSMQVQGEFETRTVATVNSNFEFIFEDDESVATLWPG